MDKALKYRGMMNELCTKGIKTEGFSTINGCVGAVVGFFYASWNFRMAISYTRISNLQHADVVLHAFFVTDVNGQSCSEGQAGWR